MSREGRPPAPPPRGRRGAAPAGGGPAAPAVAAHADALGVPQGVGSDPHPAVREVAREVADAPALPVIRGGCGLPHRGRWKRRKATWPLRRALPPADTAGARDPP